MLASGRHAHAHAQRCRPSDRSATVAAAMANCTASRSPAQALQAGVRRRQPASKHRRTEYAQTSTTQAKHPYTCERGKPELCTQPWRNQDQRQLPPNNDESCAGRAVQPKQPPLAMLAAAMTAGVVSLSRRTRALNKSRQSTTAPSGPPVASSGTPHVCRSSAACTAAKCTAHMGPGTGSAMLLSASTTFTTTPCTTGWKGAGMGSPKADLNPSTSAQMRPIQKVKVASPAQLRKPAVQSCQHPSEDMCCAASIQHTSERPHPPHSIIPATGPNKTPQEHPAQHLVAAAGPSARQHPQQSMLPAAPRRIKAARFKPRCTAPHNSHSVTWSNPL